MNEGSHESQKLFSILMTSFSYELTFEQPEQKWLFLVNYITVAVVHSDVKVFVVSFLLFLS